MKKYSHETIVGLFVIAGLLCIGYMTIKLGNFPFFGNNSYSLYAKFNSVTGLKVGNQVLMAGVEVGKVTGFHLDQENLVAVVELQLNNDVKIFGDAIASIKTAGLIGDKYVSIDPGGASDILKPGQTITETESPVDIGELIGKYAFGDVNKE